MESDIVSHRSNLAGSKYPQYPAHRRHCAEIITKPRGPIHYMITQADMATRPAGDIPIGAIIHQAIYKLQVDMVKKVKTQHWENGKTGRPPSKW